MFPSTPQQQQVSTSDDWLACLLPYLVPCVTAVMTGFMASRQQQPLCRAGERQPLEALPHCQAGRAGADLLAAAARDTGEPCRQLSPASHEPLLLLTLVAWMPIHLSTKDNCIHPLQLKLLQYGPSPAATRDTCERAITVATCAAVGVGGLDDTQTIRGCGVHTCAAQTSAFIPAASCVGHVSIQTQLQS